MFENERKEGQGKEKGAKGGKIPIRHRQESLAGEIAMAYSLPIIIARRVNGPR